MFPDHGIKPARALQQQLLRRLALELDGSGVAVISWVPGDGSTIIIQNLTLHNRAPTRMFGAGRSEGTYFEGSIQTKSSPLKGVVARACVAEESEARTMRMMRCLLLRDMAAMTRSQYLDELEG
jgi:hypothetical protein